MKIKSFILVCTTLVVIGQESLQAQQIEQRIHRKERSDQYADNRDDLNRRKWSHKAKKAHYKSMRRVAKADGKISKNERRQMKRESRKFNCKANRRIR